MKNLTQITSVLNPYIFNDGMELLYGNYQSLQQLKREIAAQSADYLNAYIAVQTFANDGSETTSPDRQTNAFLPMKDSIETFIKRLDATVAEFVNNRISVAYETSYSTLNDVDPSLAETTVQFEWCGVTMRRSEHYLTSQVMPAWTGRFLYTINGNPTIATRYNTRILRSNSSLVDGGTCWSVSTKFYDTNSSNSLTIKFGFTPLYWDSSSNTGRYIYMALVSDGRAYFCDFLYQKLPHELIDYDIQDGANMFVESIYSNIFGSMPATCPIYGGQRDIRSATWVSQSQNILVTVDDVSHTILRFEFQTSFNTASLPIASVSDATQSLFVRRKLESLINI